MAFGFEDPTIHHVIDVTAEFDPGASWGSPSVTLTFTGERAYSSASLPEATLGVFFKRGERQLAERFAQAVNSLQDEAPEPEAPAAISDEEVEAAHAAWADASFGDGGWRTVFTDTMVASQRAHIRAALEAAAKVAAAESKRRAA